MNRIQLLVLVAIGGLVAGCQSAEESTAAEPTYEVDIRWTSHGIPHVKAENWASLGYGFAYATATDAVCVIARDLVMVNGELSSYFGSAGGNLESDVFHKSVLTADKVAAFNAAHDGEVPNLGRATTRRRDDGDAHITQWL